MNILTEILLWYMLIKKIIYDGTRLHCIRSFILICLSSHIILISMHVCKDHNILSKCVFLFCFNFFPHQYVYNSCYFCSNVVFKSYCYICLMNITKRTVIFTLYRLLYLLWHIFFIKLVETFWWIFYRGFV